MNLISILIICNSICILIFVIISIIACSMIGNNDFEKITRARLAIIEYNIKKILEILRTQNE